MLKHQPSKRLRGDTDGGQIRDYIRFRLIRFIIVIKELFIVTKELFAGKDRTRFSRKDSRADFAKKSFSISLLNAERKVRRARCIEERYTLCIKNAKAACR